MIISTKGRYALRVMIDLAENGRGSYIPIKEVAARQGLSVKYLERILPALTQNKLLDGQQGKGGGYRLARSPDAITAGEILKLVEGDLSPVTCLECGAEPCNKADECRTLPLWRNLQSVISGYLDSVTIESLMKQSATDNA